MFDQRWFVEHTSLTYAGKQSVTRFRVIINLVAPKAAAKRDLLFNKPASD
jgi:hypothetical protein